MKKRIKDEEWKKRLSEMTSLELFEEFERRQRKKETALKVQIVAAIGSCICTILVIIASCCY